VTCRILVVEDEIFVATEIEHVIEEMGYTPVGIASEQRAALALAGDADVALVDLNLRDGATGITIGRILSQTHGITVMFMTANPAQLGDGVPGTIGVLPKPVTDQDLRDAVSYAVARHRATETAPPRRLQLFGTLNPT